MGGQPTRSGSDAGTGMVISSGETEVIFLLPRLWGVRRCPKIIFRLLASKVEKILKFRYRAGALDRRAS